MTLSELRLGNIIRHNVKDPESPTGFCEPNESPITEDDMWYFFGGVEMESEPIPLTEAWLLKFSADSKSLGNNMSFGNGGILHRISDGYNFIVKGYLIARVPYVHTLQNLYFALKGEELEIK